VSGRVTLVRPGSITSVSVMWWEWRDHTALATLYGWRGGRSSFFLVEIKNVAALRSGIARPAVDSQ
jgi:hypothetical protein